MPASVQKKTSEPPRSRAQQREETRASILRAALDIMIEEGIRNVRNRAVAKRAGVSLGSTTYHFASIEELIISAFLYWRESALLTENPFFHKTAELLGPFEGKTVPQNQRAQVAAQIYEIAVGYIHHQLSGKRKDRLLELAFHHESVRYPALHELIMAEWRAQLNYVTDMHRIMGSGQPDADARISVGVFRQLEQATVIGQLPAPDMGMIRSVLHRHLSLCVGINIPENTKTIS